mgnify:CR=1 FL=1
MKFSIILILSLSFTSCVKKYKQTVNICNNLYVEVFNINPSGVDVDYLTDSINFRIFVGKWDNEHENFRYLCKNDSLIIEKVTRDDNSFIVLEKRVYSLIHLKSERKFE